MAEKIIGLKKAAPYLRLYKGKTFVVKVGGDVISEQTVLEGIAEQVALLYELSINVILVHGGGPQATQLSVKLGIPVETINGRRITDSRTLDVAKMVFNGKINTDIIAALRKHKVPAIGLSGVDGGLIHARQRPVVKVTDATTGETRDVDFGFVGDVISVEKGIIHHLLAGSFVPVVSAMAGGDDGAVYNVNADVIASKIASALKVEKLIFLTDVVGVLKENGNPKSLISHMDSLGLGAIIKDGATGGMRVKLETSLEALSGGVPRVHIISGLQPDSLLLEIFTNEGVGTLIEGKNE